MFFFMILWVSKRKKKKGEKLKIMIKNKLVKKYIYF